MADIYKTIVEIEYKASGDDANKILDQQLQRVAVLEKRYEKLNKMRVNTPGLSVDPQFVKVLNDVEKQFTKVRGEAAKTIATNEAFNKSLISSTSVQTAASLRLTALQKLNRTLPNERITKEIGKIKDSGVGSFNLASVKEEGAGLLLEQLTAMSGEAGEIVTIISEINPIFGAIAGGGALLLLHYIDDANDRVKEMRIELEAINEGYSAGAVAAGKAGNEIARMTQLIDASKKGFVDKTTVLEKYNDTLGKVIGSAKTLDQAEQLIIDKSSAYIRAMQMKATANAFFNVSQKALEKSIEAQFNQETKDVTFFDKFKSFGDAIIASENKKGFGGSLEKGVQAYDSSLQKAQDVYDKRTEELQKRISQQADVLGRQTIDDLIKFAKENGLNVEELLGLDTKKTKNKLNEVENVYLRELTRLREKIKEAEIKIEISPSLITEKFTADLDKELEKLRKFLEKKQLTQSQFTTLSSLAKQLNSIELKKALKDYNDEVAKEIKDFDVKVAQLQEESLKNNINLIENQYAREIRTINSEADKTRAELERQRAELIRQANEDLKKYTDPVVQTAIKERINQINKAYKQLDTDNEAERFKKLEKAAERAFETIKQKAQDASTMAEQFRNKQLQQALEQQFNAFLSGNQASAITRRNVNILQRDAAIDQTKIQLEAAEKQRRLNASRITKSESEIDKLTLENSKLDETIATLRARIAELEGAKKDDAIEKALGKIRQGVEIDNFITDAFSRIIAQQESQVDREIAVQERRIDRLKEVADRGNAEMLEMEEKRLRQSQEMKERYARQQLALQLIQQAGALTLAIAQAAAEPFPLNIPAIASTIAAIAAGISTVRQLNQPVQGFKDGVIDFRGKGSTTSDSNVVTISNRESVMTAQATANNKDILMQMNKGRKFVTAENVNVHSQKQTELKVQELTDEVKELRRDVREAQGTTVILDKKGVVTIVEQVLKSNKVKWQL